MADLTEEERELLDRVYEEHIVRNGKPGHPDDELDEEEES